MDKPAQEHPHSEHHTTEHHQQESHHATREHHEPHAPKHHAYPQHDFQDIKTLLAWSAPGRPFRHKSREFFTSVMLLTFFFELIAFLFSQYELMMVILALAFLSVVLAKTPPVESHYRLSTEGIMGEDYFYLWSELYDFYFKRIDGMDVLHIRTQEYYPGELKLTLGDHITPQEVRKVLVKYLPYREYVPHSSMERMGDWLARTFPLDSQK